MEIPFSHLIVPRTVFAPNNVPPVMIQGLPPQLQELVPLVTAEVLNRAMDASSRNAMRIYMLNCLVVNNYQSSDLRMVVDFVIRQAFLDCVGRNDSPASIKAYIPNAADQILGLLSSVKGVAHQGIRNTLSSHDLSAAYNNNSAYNEIVRTLQMVDFRVFLPPTQGNNVYGQPAPFHNNYQPQFSGGIPPGNNSPAGNTLGAQWGSSPAPAAPPMQQQPAPALQQSNWFENANRQYGHVVQPAAAPIQELSQPTYGVPQEAVPTGPTAAPVNASSQPLQVVTTQGTNEMDYDVHSLIYFGNGMPLDLSSRRTDLKMANLSLSQAGRKAGREGDLVLLNRKLTPEIGIDNAIFAATASMLASTPEDNEGPVIYRQFLNIIQPVSCTKEVTKIVETLMGASSNLDNLASNIANGLKASIKDPVRPTREELGALNALAFLDRRLAVEVNRFIRLNLNSSVRIESFTEDYPGLPAYMGRKDGRFPEAMQRWAAVFFDHLKSNMDETTREFLIGYFDTETSGSLYLPSVQSLTMLNVTYKELGYTVSDDGPMLIDPKTTMNLYDIAEGLRANKRDLKVHTTLDWLVTADDQRFLISELATEPGKYLLSRA